MALNQIGVGETNLDKEVSSGHVKVQGQKEALDQLRSATIARLLAAEIFIIFGVSGVLCGAIVFLVQAYSRDFVRLLFIR